MLRPVARITILAGAMTVLTVAAPALPAATGPSLTIAGTSFAVDGRPRFLLLVSYFDALRASDATLDGALRPAVQARLKAVIAAAGRHGLIVDLSFARETVRDTAGRELSPSAYG